MKKNHEPKPEAGGRFCGVKMSDKLYSAIRAAAILDWEAGKSGFPSTAATIRALCVDGLNWRELEKARLDAELVHVTGAKCHG